ncbi:MAG: domain S-box protein [Chloroflexi bacterium]|jgi:signal transduction histidine kinase/CheY-like chemotaxis protein|nr:domain S-box protein [Chloroflexota bacterium]
MGSQEQKHYEPLITANVGLTYPSLQIPENETVCRDLERRIYLTRRLALLLSIAASIYSFIFVLIALLNSNQGLFFYGLLVLCESLGFLAIFKFANPKGNLGRANLSGQLLIFWLLVIITAGTPVLGSGNIITAALLIVPVIACLIGLSRTHVIFFTALVILALSLTYSFEFIFRLYKPFLNLADFKYLVLLFWVFLVIVLVVCIIIFVERLNQATATSEKQTDQLRELVKSLDRSTEISASLKQAEQAMKEAKEAAETANRSKSEFLANMSHEIRTPLNGVIGMTGLLLDTSLTSQQRSYAETVRISGENLLTIINDILDFSKIEAGKMNIEEIDFELTPVVEGVARLLAERAFAKDLELLTQVEFELLHTVRGDQFRLTQILINLVGNAIKFTRKGEVTIHARPDRVENNQDYIRFEVKDTGIGISQEQQRYLFKPFSQADSSTTRKFGGTGLGLAISAQLVKLMGGEIGVESVPGKGSTFWFTLPLKKQPGSRTPVQPRTHLRGLRVLIVDDNATNQAILHEQIVGWGMENGSTSSGLEALEKLHTNVINNEPYDLALLDMQMPGMDGMTLARAIKSDPALASTRLILLTSIGQPGLTTELQEAGIAACLVKPVRKSELYNCMANVMANATGEYHHPVRAVGLLRPLPQDYKAPSAILGRILVAEDNIINQQVAVGMLEAGGYRVDVVTNGHEALSALERRSYDAILMDCQMPEMDGYAATIEIRRREGETLRTPVIAMTANALFGEREKCLAAEMDDYITKPVNPSDLYALLEKWIKPVGSRANPPKSESVETSTEVKTAPFVGVLDEAVLQNLLKLQSVSGTDVLGKVIDLFSENTPKRLAELKESINLNDANALARIAHSLKGSSGNVGASHLATLLAELEDLNREGNMDRVTGLLGRIETEFEQAKVALIKFHKLGR